MGPLDSEHTVCSSISSLKKNASRDNGRHIVCFRSNLSLSPFSNRGVPLFVSCTSILILLCCSSSHLTKWQNKKKRKRKKKRKKWSCLSDRTREDTSWIWPQLMQQPTILTAYCLQASWLTISSLTIWFGELGLWNPVEYGRQPCIATLWLPAWAQSARLLQGWMGLIVGLSCLNEHGQKRPKWDLKLVCWLCHCANISSKCLIWCLRAYLRQPSITNQTQTLCCFQKPNEESQAGTNRPALDDDLIYFKGNGLVPGSGSLLPPMQAAFMSEFSPVKSHVTSTGRILVKFCVDDSILLQHSCRSSGLQAGWRVSWQWVSSGHWGFRGHLSYDSRSPDCSIRLFRSALERSCITDKS